MVGENLQIYIVQTARKCILWVKKLKADTFAHRQNSPLGSCHSPQIEGNYSSPREHLFFVKIPSLAERQRERNMNLLTNIWISGSLIQRYVKSWVMPESDENLSLLLQKLNRRLSTLGRYYSPLFYSCPFEKLIDKSWYWPPSEITFISFFQIVSNITTVSTLLREIEIQYSRK